MGCTQSSPSKPAEANLQKAVPPQTNTMSDTQETKPTVSSADVNVTTNGTAATAASNGTNQPAGADAAAVHAIAAAAATTSAIPPVGPARPAATLALTVGTTGHAPLTAAPLAVSKQRPLVVCGPSGVGKGTLLTRLLKEYPQVFAKSVSHTTRAPRAGEVDGISYHFTTPDALLAGVSRGEFVEHANVHGNYYGTSIASVARVMDSGKICILEIDIQGVLAVKKLASLNPLAVFVRAPTFQDLVDRLNGRGSENAATLQARLDTARNEMDFFYTHRAVFDADVINDEFEASYASLVDTIRRLYPEVHM